MPREAEADDPARLACWALFMSIRRGFLRAPPAAPVPSLSVSRIGLRSSALDLGIFGLLHTLVFYLPFFEAQKAPHEAALSKAH